jgi:hypothetical protein
VNARRQGVDGEQGSYMLRFGRFIRKLERLQGEDKLFFLVENVVLTGEDLENVCDAFGLEWDPIEFDSQYFSPQVYIWCRACCFLCNQYQPKMHDSCYVVSCFVFALQYPKTSPFSHKYPSGTE